MTILSKPGDPLLTICAWHADFDKNDPLNANASHGICNECLEKFSAPAAVPAREKAAA